jgi:hypothetical protein
MTGELNPGILAAVHSMDMTSSVHWPWCTLQCEWIVGHYKFKAHLSWAVVGIKYPVLLKLNMLNALPLGKEPVVLIVLDTRKSAELI